MRPPRRRALSHAHDRHGISGVWRCIAGGSQSPRPRTRTRRRRDRAGMSGVHATPDDQRDAIIMAALPHVPFDGWGPATLRRAAESLALGGDAATRLFPDGSTAAVTHF